LLIQIGEHQPVTIPGLSQRLNADPQIIRSITERLFELHLIAVEQPMPTTEAQGLSNTGPGEQSQPIRLTDEGEMTCERLVEARREGLKELLAGWSPEQHSDLAEMLTQLSHELLGDEISRKIVSDKE
jgi:hypothetical protein